MNDLNKQWKMNRNEINTEVTGDLKIKQSKNDIVNSYLMKESSNNENLEKKHNKKFSIKNIFKKKG